MESSLNMRRLHITANNLSERASMGNSTEEFIPPALRILDAVLVMTITVLGIAGNTLVFTAYLLSRKLRTKTNIFVVNLALADVLTCLCLPVVGWSLLIEVSPSEPIDPSIDILCGIDFGLIQVFVSSSIMTLALIAVNRYILITKSKDTYEWVYQQKFIIASICFSWTFPVLFVTLPLPFNVGHLGFDIKIHACGARTDHRFSYLYDIIVISNAIIPIALIIYSYGGIYLYLKKHNRHLHKGRMTTLLFNFFRSNVISENTTRPGLSQNQVHITKNLFLILVSFFMCLTPHIVCELIDAHFLITIHTKIIVALSSCVNPILYGARHPHFRRVFKSILSCRWSEIPDPAFKWMKKGPPTSINVSKSRSKELEAVSLSILANRC